MSDWQKKAQDMQHRSHEVVSSAEAELEKVRSAAGRQYSVAAPDISKLEALSPGSAPGLLDLENSYELSDPSWQPKDMSPEDDTRRGKIQAELQLKMAQEEAEKEKSRLGDLQEEMWQLEIEKQQLAQASAMQKAEISHLRFQLSKMPPANTGFNYLELHGEPVARKSLQPGPECPQTGGVQPIFAANANKPHTFLPSEHSIPAHTGVPTIASKFRQAREDAWKTLLEVQQPQQGSQSGLTFNGVKFVPLFVAH